MSQENVEIVRRMNEAWDQGDVTAAFADYHPDIECDLTDVMLFFSGFDPFDFARVLRGHEEVRDYLREWSSAWQTVEIVQDGLTDAGEHVVHYLRQSVGGRQSGIEFDFETYAQVWTLREGKIVRMKLYADRSKALEAVGLAE